MGSHLTVLEDAPIEDSWRLQAKGQQICYSAADRQIRVCRKFSSDSKAIRKVFFRQLGY